MTLSSGALGANVRRRWTPKALGADLVAWYDASLSGSVTSDANGVSQWNDQSGNGYDLTQATNANKPTYASSRMSFSGNQWMTSGASASDISRCGAAVVQFTTATAMENIIGTSTSSGGWVMGRSEAANAYPRRLYVAKQGVAYISAPVNNSTLYFADNADTVVLGNTTSSTFRASMNGTAVTGSHSQTLTASRTLMLSLNQNTYGLTGSLREVVLAKELSTADQQRLEGYLAWKWSLQANLPNDHPYKSFRP